MPLLQSMQTMLGDANCHGKPRLLNGSILTFFYHCSTHLKESELHLSRTRTYCFQHKSTQAWRVPAKDPALTLTKVCSAPPSTQHDSYLWPLSFQALERAKTHQWSRAALLACCFAKKQCLRAALSRGIRRMQVSPALE